MDDTSHSRYLGAMSFNPHITFETQHADETPVLILRAHPVTQIPWVINAIVILIILVVSNILFLPVLLLNYSILINAFGLVFVFSYVWYNFLHWYFNVGIITNERVVDVDFSNVLYKEVNITYLSKIEDITAKSAGYFGALFHYGDVYIQTAGNEINIEFESIPEPSQVIEVINRLSKP